MGAQIDGAVSRSLGKRTMAITRIGQRRPRGNLALLAGSTAIAFLVAEVGGRMWLDHLASPEAYAELALFADVPAEKRQWSPHHYLDYYPTPNYRKGGTHHNSLGYRGEEFTREKPEGVFRIVAIGGSSVYTITVEDDAETFPAQLQTVLRERYGHERVEVINAGVGGFNSWESLIDLEFRVLDLDPDLIVVYHGVNDVHARLVSPAGAYRSDNSGRRRQWSAPPVSLLERSCFLRILGRKLGVFRQVELGSFVNAPTFVGGGSRRLAPPDELDRLLAHNPPVFFRRNLISTLAVARAHGVAVLFATFAYCPHFDKIQSQEAYQRGYAEMNDTVVEVGERYQVPVFPFAERMPQDAEYWSDSVHVNEKGAVRKAELFAEFIDEQGLMTTAGPRQ